MAYAGLIVWTATAASGPSHGGAVDPRRDGQTAWRNSGDLALYPMRVQRPIKAMIADVKIDEHWEPRLVVSVPVEYATEADRPVDGLTRVTPIDFDLDTEHGIVRTTIDVRVS